MAKENNKEKNNDSSYLYIIAIVAIVAIVAMVMMMSTPRAPVNSGTMSDDDLAGQAVIKNNKIIANTGDSGKCKGGKTEGSSCSPADGSTRCDCYYDENDVRTCGICMPNYL